LQQHHHHRQLYGHGVNNIFPTQLPGQSRRVRHLKKAKSQAAKVAKDIELRGGSRVVSTSDA